MVDLGISSVEPLAKMVKTGNIDIQREAMITLKKIGEPAVEGLIELMKTGDETVRSEVMKILETLVGSKELISNKHFRRFLMDEDPLLHELK